ncbi:GIY-YIG nuclease family protein [Ralstonia mannitolilytica]|uniref:GIY-YIG nuclease family protein n=1 Tax=Ralstonia mannitolilytica TaxID=105219 RepID=UPI0029319663|nr:GIY-YIG nuclease family protein [Ralstonia mannitolilytica]
MTQTSSVIEPPANVTAIRTRNEITNPGTMTEKKDYQRLINAEGIATMAQLLTFVAQHGLTVTQRGSAYVTVEEASGRRFRLFLADHEKAGKAGTLAGTEVVYDFWIYALVASDPTLKACYIGQTRDLSRRMREHWKRRAGERGSGPLFEWATQYGLTVNVVLLESLSGSQGSADRAEAAWFARAVAEGYELPGVEYWAPRGDRKRRGLAWPSAAVRRNSRPLEAVATGITQVVRLETNSALVDHNPEGLRLA